MFVSNPIITDKVNRAVEMVRATGRGNIAPHEAFERIFDMSRHSSGYYGLVEKVNKRLMREFHIEVSNIKGVGYYVCLPEHQVIHQPQKFRDRAGRRVSRGLKSVVLSPDLELSDHMRTVKVKQIDQFTSDQKQLRSSKKITCAIYKSSESHRRPQVAA